MAKRPGHLENTKANRELLLGVARDEKNYLYTKIEGSRVYRKVIDDNKQLWVEVRDGIIQNGGINNTSRED
ncbi:MAG: hypothetical protein LBN34_07695 [Clostridiales Family XIII bacterium]|jgi:hypothetical protein|nr:hypothetical protein [Clostridiales Family XIII bacterium]